MITHDTLDEWFTYKAPSVDQVNKMTIVRNAAKDLAHDILAQVPPGPDQTAAIRKLRECVMTANLGIMFQLEESLK